MPALETSNAGQTNAGRRHRFRTQERFLQNALQELQDRLTHWLREASFQRSINIAASARPLLRCRELQADYDSLATELVHIRMERHGADSR